MEVDINQIQPNNYNPKTTEENVERYEAVKMGIAEMTNELGSSGMKTPIDVREIDGDIPYEIIDGFHRWKACKELGWTIIPISSWGKITEDQSKKITILKEKARIPLDLLKTSKILAELAKDTSLDILARQVGYSLPNLQEDLKLVNFNWSEYEKNKENTPEDGTSQQLKNLIITMTTEQYEVVQQAFRRVKERAEGQEITEARCIELICADYLAGK